MKGKQVWLYYIAEQRPGDRLALSRIFRLFSIAQKIPTKIMPPKKILAKFQIPTQKNPGIENSSNQKILRSSLKLEIRSTPHPGAPLVLPNETFLISSFKR